MIDIELESIVLTNNCMYCGTPVDPSSAFGCSRCGSTIHTDCMVEARECSTKECGSKDFRPYEFLMEETSLVPVEESDEITGSDLVHYLLHEYKEPIITRSYKKIKSAIEEDPDLGTVVNCFMEEAIPAYKCKRNTQNAGLTMLLGGAGLGAAILYMGLLSAEKLGVDFQIFLTIIPIVLAFEGYCINRTVVLSDRLMGRVYKIGDKYAEHLKNPQKFLATYEERKLLESEE